jgi:hypothetical protein
MTLVENKDELVKRYKDFVSNINDITLRDKLNQVPSEKAYWAQILSDYEKALYKLQATQKSMIKDLSKKLIEKSPVSLTKSILDNVKDDTSLDNINSHIQELEIAIKHFSRIYENVKYIAKDFENILKYKQLQDS